MQLLRSVTPWPFACLVALPCGPVAAACLALLCPMARAQAPAPAHLVIAP